MNQEHHEELIITEINGEEHCDHELALAWLLEHGVLMANERETMYEGQKEGKTIVLYVLCSDIFAWACADAEDLPLDQVSVLYKAVKADPKWGAAKWCAKKRECLPQQPAIDLMKKDGAWDAEMEALQNTVNEQNTTVPDGPAGTGGSR